MAQPGTHPLKSLADSNLTTEKAILIGKAIGCRYKRITVGREMNPNSEMMACAVISGLLAAGADVWNVGIAPTPAVTMAGKRTECTIMVGEPDTYGEMSNLSVYNPDGSAFGELRIKELIRNFEVEMTLPDYKGVGNIHMCDTVIKDYMEAFKDMYDRKNDSSDSPIFLDCGCGCTALCAPQILAACGTDLTTLNSQMDEDFVPRSPGVEKDDITTISTIVSEDLGTIGIALNGDGTRLALVDESGYYINDEEVTALLFLYLKPTIAVVPLHMSTIVDDAFYGTIGNDIVTPYEAHESRKLIKTERTPKAFMEAIKANSADIGVMDDGSYIFPGLSYCPDAIRAAAIIAEMAGKNSLQDIITSFPDYLKIKDTVRFSGNIDIFYKKVGTKLAELDTVEVLPMDGWMVILKNGWFQISLSETDKDFIEITAESRDRLFLVTTMEVAKDIVQNCL